MFAFPERLLLSLILMLTTAAVGAAPPTAEEIAKAVRDLGANRFAAREKASAFLRAAGRAAEPALLEAAKSKDVEVARRAKEILEEFKWGIYPDTPKEVLQQVRDYRGGDASVKQKAIAALASLGTPGYVTLLKMASAEEDAASRTLLTQFLATESTRAIPILLVDRQEDTAEQLAEIAQTVLKEVNVRHYAAFLLQRKRLDAKIAHYQAQAAKANGDAGWILIYLYRAKGDLPAARQAAEKFKDKSWATLILGEEGNWQELAKRTDDPKPDIETLSYRAAYQRLAGQAAEFERTVADLRKAADAEPEQSPLSRQVAKALFLNDRPAEALAVLLAKKNDMPAFDVMTAQLKYSQALDLPAQAKKTDAETPRYLWQLRQANVLYAQLGEKDKGLEALARAAELVKQDGTAKAYGELIRAEQRLGRTEQAFEDCAVALAKLGKSEHSAPATQLLDICFPERGASALVWWTFLRKKHAAEKEVATMQRLRDLFAGKVVGEKWTALARELEEETLGENIKSADLAAYFLAVAEVCEAANAPDSARPLLKKYAKVLGTAASWQRLGDFLAKHGRDYKEAADCYEKAFRKDVRQPLPLFLRGQALAQTGQKDEGRRLVELAHRIPLADDETRYAFAGALADRGFAADSRREYELILRVGPGEGWYTNETLRHLGYEAMGRKDYRQAAEFFERFRLRCLKANTSFVEYSAYVHVPAVVLQNRARAAIQAVKLDEAKRAVEQCLAALPGGVQLPIELVAALDKAGRTKDGDEIFHRVFDLYEKLAAEHPKGASLHNTVAWVAATCRRELNKALAHAEKAVALAPDEAGYLDTLAEVCFQRGDKERAVKLMKRCTQLEPSNDYFPRQLQRIEKGDPKAPLPEGA